MINCLRHHTAAILIVTITASLFFAPAAFAEEVDFPIQVVNTRDVPISTGVYMDENGPEGTLINPQPGEYTSTDASGWGTWRGVTGETATAWALVGGGCSWDYGSGFPDAPNVRMDFHNVQEGVAQQGVVPVLNAQWDGVSYQRAIVDKAMTINEARLLAHINAERKRLGRNELVPVDRLNYAAMKHSYWQASNKILGHCGDRGSSHHTRIQDTGMVAGDAGMTGETNSSTNDPSAAWRAFQNSPPHYSALMNQNYTRIGIGIVNGMTTAKLVSVCYSGCGSVVTPPAIPTTNTNTASSNPSPPVMRGTRFVGSLQRGRVVNVCRMIRGVRRCGPTRVVRIRLVYQGRVMIDGQPARNAPVLLQRRNRNGQLQRIGVIRTNSQGYYRRVVSAPVPRNWWHNPGRWYVHVWPHGRIVTTNNGNNRAMMLRIRRGR